MKKLINKRRLPTPIPTMRLGAVPLGATFVFRVKEILGSQYCGKMPPYEGQVLTVVGFKPRLKNNIVVRNSNGYEFLMPLEMVQKALTLKFNH